VLVSLDPEVLVSLFLLFLWCLPDFFLLDLVVPVSLDVLELVVPLDPLDVLPLWSL
jgi:hypothetical protein